MRPNERPVLSRNCVYVGPVWIAAGGGARATASAQASRATRSSNFIFRLAVPTSGRLGRGAGGAGPGGRPSGCLCWARDGRFGAGLELDCSETGRRAKARLMPHLAFSLDFYAKGSLQLVACFAWPADVSVASGTRAMHCRKFNRTEIAF